MLAGHAIAMPRGGGGNAGANNGDANANGNSNGELGPVSKSLLCRSETN